MTEGSSGPVVRSLVLAPDLAELERARGFAGEAAAEAGFSEDRAFDVMVASSEATANAIEHAPVKGEVTIKSLLYPDRLEIQIEGPGEFQAPHRLSGRSHRGLGLPLMAQFSDHLALYSGPRGGVLVGLTFYRPGVEPLVEEPIPPSIRELVEENELVSAITSNAPVGLYVLDPALRYRWANPAYHSFLDEPFSSSDLTGLAIAAVVPGIAESGVLAELEEASRTGIAIGPSDRELIGLSRGPTWWRRSIVPLTGARREPPYDLLVVVTEETERKLAEDALRESEEQHRAIAEVNERLYRQQLEIAEGLQLALLNIPSEIGRLRVGHLYRSATEAASVGGDFYDVFEAKDGAIAVLIGDVAGHGIQAARTGTMVKDVVHAFAHQSLRTNEVLRRTNLLLIEKDLPGFVTLFLGILDTDTGVLRYSSAGHPESILKRVSGEMQMLGCGTSPLGIYPDASWRPHETGLGPDDVLLLYTDGVTEARRQGELFGEDRLKRVLTHRSLSVGRLPQVILDRVLAFSGGSLHDDLAILALSLTEVPEAPRPKEEPLQQNLLDGWPEPTQTTL